MAAPDTPLMVEARKAVARATQVDTMDDWALLATIAHLQAVLEKFIEVTDAAEGGEFR
jgi:hypothetical protein